jgi:hypothetical protein
MAITPTGAPAWARTNTHETFGGNVDKTNHLSRGVIDALTDVGAEQLCRIAADLAALERTAPVAVLTYTCNDSTSGAPTILYANMMTGVRNTSYAGDAAPTGYPSAARNGNGDVTFTFAASMTDDYGVSAAWAPTQCISDPLGVSAYYSTANPFGATVRVRSYDQTGTALVDPTITLTVW